MNEMDVPAEPDPMTAALLEQLKDVALSDPAPWWPPAPGWWLVAAILLVVAALIVRVIVERRRRNRYRKEAATLLDELRTIWESDRDDHAYASGAHQLVRRAAIHVAGRDAISRLTGRAFVDHVNTLSMAPLSRETGSLLTEFSYRATSPDGLDLERIHAELEAWLSQLEGPHRA